MQQGVQTDGKCNILALSLILVLLRRFPSTSWSIHFGDVSKANARETLDKNRMRYCFDVKIDFCSFNLFVLFKNPWINP